MLARPLQRVHCYSVYVVFLYILCMHFANFFLYSFVSTLLSHRIGRMRRMRSSLITRKLRKHAPGTKYGRSVAPKYGDFVYVEGCPHVGCVLDANLKSKVIYHLLAFVFICLHLFYLLAFVFICLHLFFFCVRICLHLFFFCLHLFFLIPACLPALTRPPAALTRVQTSWSRQLRCVFPDSKKGTSELVKKKHCLKAPELGALFMCVFIRFLCMCVIWVSLHVLTC